jgi:hypothetical protein
MMDESGRKLWLRVATLVGVVYFVVGWVFAAVANPAVSDRLRFRWRLAAWVVSGAFFAAHISYEHFRLRNSPRATSLHVAFAVGLGAFLLAVNATVHALLAPSHAPYARYLLALVLWPILTALPAFLIALAVAAALAHRSTKRLAE